MTNERERENRNQNRPEAEEDEDWDDEQRGTSQRRNEQRNKRQAAAVAALLGGDDGGRYRTPLEPFIGFLVAVIDRCELITWAPFRRQLSLGAARISRSTEKIKMKKTKKKTAKKEFQC